MEYITTKEASAKWGITTSRITLLANEGRIPGAHRLGKSWLIPATTTKPEPRKANHSGVSQKENDDLSFPMYHLRPDWSYIKESKLPKQQQDLLAAETAVFECRFHDAYPILEALLQSPIDKITEIGCLWNAGICCIALNTPTDFFKILLRLQLLLAEDFPHKNDLTIILDSLRNYMDTLESVANTDTIYADIHEQAIPLMCVQLGYKYLALETLNLGTADISLLELNLRLLKNTSAVIAVEMMHCYLTGIYYLRQDMDNATRNAEAVIQLAYENKLYFPLVTYYRYFSQVFAPILDKYPKEFSLHCHKLISQYEEKFTAFFSYINEDSVISKLTDSDYLYIHGVLMDLSNTGIANQLNVHPQTVKRKLKKLCEEMGVRTKKELKEYLRNYL